MNESACDYLFGCVSPKLRKDEDARFVCRVYVEIFHQLHEKWTKPQVAAALGDLVASGRVYANSTNVERRFITMRHMKHQIIYIRDILPFV